MMLEVGATGYQEPTSGLAPDGLEWALEGWSPPGPNAFRWRDDRLRFWHDGATLSVAPSDDEWPAFWRICDELAVWSWPAVVRKTEIEDGLQFGLVLRRGDRPAESSGKPTRQRRAFARSYTPVIGRSDHWSAG